MKIGIIIETNDLEKAWNGLRFAVTAKSERNHEVKVFLMGAGVEVEGLTDKLYNTQEQLYKFRDLGGEVLACGTCMISRDMEETETCPISTMIDCIEMVVWADQVITF